MTPGAVGTVVGSYGRGGYEVEFVADDGSATAVVTPAAVFCASAERGTAPGSAGALERTWRLRVTPPRRRDRGYRRGGKGYFPRATSIMKSMCDST
ncbi:DUF4926 domain-containing protein [[Mycobacterium] burgundiense]|uniref:DUF4926 domain-containing protein n=1 Tax=[Mycobacterium] burgundiense TaxID=3064286 RepID=A0ABM9LV79_9MYCO|nr:DUF4926 domain-containing protein [Mycolicibacterium sp. MU0053]CAJ1505285.1 DUF4926 domain-containing protein [Mycolicibacterium sp. MU0053]